MIDPSSPASDELEKAREALLAGLAAPSITWLVGPAGAARTHLLEALQAKAHQAGAPVFKLRGQGPEAAPYAAFASVFESLALVVPTPLEATGEPGARLALQAQLVEATRAREAAVWLVDDADRLDSGSLDALAVLRRADASWRWVLAKEPGPARPRRHTRHFKARLLPQPARGQSLARLLGSAPRRERPLARSRERVVYLGPQAPEALPPLVATASAAGAGLALWGLEGALEAAHALVGADAVQALEGAGVLAVAAGRYRFTRPAWAALLADGLAPQARRAWHQRCFELAAVGEPDPRRGLAALWPAARHGALGAPGPEATPWVVAGARAALALYELERADELWCALPPSAGLEAGLVRVHLLRLRGEVAAARALFEQLAPPATPEHLTTAGVLAQLAGDYPGAARSYREAAEHAEALGLAEPAVRARLFAGRLAYMQGELDQAGQHFERALALDAPALTGWALALWAHWLTTRPGRATEGLARLHEAIGLCRAAHQVYWTLEALNSLGDVHLAQGEPLAAREAFAECLAIAERHGLRTELPFARVNLAFAALSRGDFASAHAHAASALALGREQGRPYPEGLALAAWGLAEVYLGRGGSGLAHLARSAGLAATLGNQALALAAAACEAEARLELGDWAGCRLALVRARALEARTGIVEHAPRLHFVSLGLAVLGASPEAERATAAAVREGRAGLPGACALAWRGCWLARQGQGADELARALVLARACGALQLEALVARAAGQPLVALEAVRMGQHRSLAASLAASHHPDACERLEGARRLRELAGSLPDELREGFWAHPWRAGRRGQPGGVAALWQHAEPASLLRHATLLLLAHLGAEAGTLLLYEGLELVEGVSVGEPGELDLALAHAVRFGGTAIVQAQGGRYLLAQPLGTGEAAVGVLLAVGHGAPDEVDGLAAELAGLVAAARREQQAREALARLGEVHALALAALASADPWQLVSARALARVGGHAASLLAGPAFDGRPGWVPEALAAWAYEGARLVVAEAADGPGAVWLVPVLVAGRCTGLLALATRQGVTARVDRTYLKGCGEVLGALGEPPQAAG